ncbi:hypothetical protein BIFDEN_01716 [Bifidobacterium dentium ATCC 27678]|nr:hypothetical protein BIFDEN_01716 [Bifidobacterium dentium ATCC 27678]
MTVFCPMSALMRSRMPDLHHIFGPMSSGTRRTGTGFICGIV